MKKAQDIKTVVLTGDDLTLNELVAIARYDAVVEISDKAVEEVNRARKIVDDIVDNEIVTYGINTGFGSLCNVSISKEDSIQLQENLIRTHASGYGDPFSTDIVRAIMAIRANSLTKGYSGIRLCVIEKLVEMLNKHVSPIIPEKGSLGASGDLAPLSHMVLPILGLGEAEYEGVRMSGKDAMAKAGVETMSLASKEGLALINGTQALTATGSLALYDAMRLLKVSDIAGALSLEAQNGIIDAFDEELHVIRNHRGQVQTASNIRALVEGSTFVTKQGELRVQDAYSLRCMPQIHGASKDTINFVSEKVAIEMNSVTDNPIITRDKRAISGGNFHGQPMALPFDFLGIGTAEIANVSERRLERLVNVEHSKLSSFLVAKSGLNSGFMITQYAAAALVSENKILAHPASVDSIPSCENQEDLVSMGTIAARKAKEIGKNTSRVVATEILAACQAIDMRAEKQPDHKLGKGTKAAYDVVRKYCKFIDEDKNIEMYKELETITDLIMSDEFVDAVENAVTINI
ncbi:histidine ammonia-lyase [Vagococcus vulneris]|uniref:Histidine ammonia-lyase n=1 Tax=Vagococcus vulneris TaxID=1977869 RepID=A0A429ZXB5_9ENTE|nr:histidine ammonia-lyase [Vagococcus vulneris]RST98410.1 histidine ammonia-lyase [Vagococcus vulneris]